MTTSAIRSPEAIRDPAMGSTSSPAQSITMANTSHSTPNRADFEPFQAWVSDRAWAPGGLDALRMESISPLGRETSWRNKRRHAPCTVKAPQGVDLDVVYLREAHELGYVNRLVTGTTNVPSSGTSEVDASFLFLDQPLAPYHWSPNPQRHHGDPIAEYPRGGDIF
jgi:hypothetical protein